MIPPQTLRMFQIIFLIAKWVKATIDVNLAEMLYISDHLKPEECRQLIAALHEKSFELSMNIDSAVQEIPDESCLKLLLHWNSMPGEGRGENHEFLCRRLKQLGKKELADWLSRTVYHQLGQDLNNSLLGNPFREASVITEQTSVSDNQDDFFKNSGISNSWIALDIAVYFILAMLAVASLFLIMALTWKNCSQKRGKTTNDTSNFKPNPKVHGNYIPLEDSSLIEGQDEWSWNSRV